MLIQLTELNDKTTKTRRILVNTSQIHEVIPFGKFTQVVTTNRVLKVTEPPEEMLAAQNRQTNRIISQLAEVSSAIDASG